MLLMSPIDHPFPNDVVYNLECYPNFFTACFKHSATGRRWVFEISGWKNQGKELHAYLMSLSHFKYRLVGYNNVKYDYPMIHFITQQRGITNHELLYAKSRAILDDFSGWGNMIWERDVVVKQLDLMAIHHFDNMAKLTSLKLLKFNMCSDIVWDQPFDCEAPVTREQADYITAFNDNQVDETDKFYWYTFDQIKFREELHSFFGKSVINHNDGKIGQEFIVKALHENGVQTKVNGKKVQSIREFVNLGEVIFPYIQFENPEFIRIKEFFESQVIKPDEMKGFFGNLSAVIKGFSFDFGAGGIHGSQLTTIVRSTATHILIDEDVASFYPNIGIQNKIYPEHLTEAFCPVYLGLYTKRKTYAKGTPTNNGLKLALNTAYGNSNNAYSEFYDPKYTLTITINGQLMLCMLAEQLMKIPGLEMVQVNTDGLTYLCPREYQAHARKLSAWWEKVTKLQLEDVGYDAMYIRDVNNYMAVTTKGYVDREGNEAKKSKVKRIGAYASARALNNSGTRELCWHKNHSAVVVALAAEQALINGTNIEEFIRGHKNMHDFMLRTKVPRSCKLEYDEDELIQNVSRYYISTDGGTLNKIMPPTASQIENYLNGDHYRHETTGKYAVVKSGKKPPSGKFKLVENPDRTAPERRIGISKGWLCYVCNNIYDARTDNIDYSYYIAETRKIVDPLLLGEKARC